MVITSDIFACESRDRPFVEVFRRSAARAGYALTLLRPAPTPPADFAALARAYRHLSPNAASFELAAIRRYFEIRDAVRGRDPFAPFIVADSDVLVLGRPADLPAELEAARGGVAGSIGTTDGQPETDISGHFALWTAPLLGAFCAFACAAYAAGAERLAAIHAARIAAGNPRAAISDMTLIYLFVTDNGLPFVNTNRLFGNTYLDHNIFMSDCADARFRTRLGHKVFNFAGGRTALTTCEGEQVTPLTLHFVGRTKNFMPAVERREPALIALHSAYILAGRTLRRLAQ